MSLSPTLPPKLHYKLLALEKRVRRLRAVQGSVRVLLLLVCSAFLIIAADSYFALSSPLRCLAFVGWLGLGTLAIRKWLIAPLVEPIDPTALAAAVEEQYPRLDERLTTAVELSRSPGETNGSPAFVDAIVNEAATRSKRLDFDVSLPTREVVWFSVLSLVAIAVILTPLFVVAEPGQKLARFFVPWHTPRPEINYRITVTSGDPGVKRGESVTLTGFVEPTKAGAALPKFARLLVKTPDGEVNKVPMMGEQENVYYVRRGGVQNDFEYAVEAGHLTSEWHTVRAVDPVNLVSAQVKVQPPGYVSKEEEKIEGLAELRPWQHSKVTFLIQLDRAPLVAYLEWTPDRRDAGGENGEKVGSASIQKLKLEVDESHLGKLTVAAKESGSFKLVLESEQKVRNEFRAQPMVVRVDQPPKFEKVTGIADRSRQLAPAEKLSVTAQVTDDVGVAGLDLEYRTNGGAPQLLPLPLEGKGTPQVNGRSPLEFLKQLKEGDRVEYRLVASDGRDVPEANLRPQKVYYPTGTDSWSVLELKQNAPSLKQQDILGQQGEINERLDKLVKEFRSEQQAGGQLKKESKTSPTLDDKQVNRLGLLREEVRDSGGKLDALARDAEVTPELRRLAQEMRAVSERETRDAETALQQSQFEKVSEARTKQFETAESNLAKAVEKLQELKRENDRVAQARLDQFNIENLKDRQELLAERTKNADVKDYQDLLKKQKELEDNLQSLVDQQENLRKALDQANAREAEKIAEQLKDLAQKQRDLAQAMRQTQQEKLQKKLAELVKQQRELLEKAERLRKKTETASDVAQAAKLDPTSTRDAVNALEKGELNDALKTQELSALNLDEHALRLERAAKKAEDAREAARQLARWQQSLKTRLEEALQDEKKIPTEELRKALAEEQERLRKAIESLRTPREGSAKSTRDEAAQSAKKSAEGLKGDRLDGTAESMRETQQKLDALGESLPALEKRLAQAKDEVQKLRKEQEALSKQVEQYLKPFEKADPSKEETKKKIASRLADLLKKQEAISERLGKIDTPTHESRKEQAVEAMRRAEGDLVEPRPWDAQASQGQARRELERLEQALGGQKPADEKVEELLQREREIARQVEESVQDPSKAKGLTQKQQEINREIQSLQTSESLLRQEDALDAGRKLAATLDGNAKPEELARAAKEATEAVQRLADAVNGRETPAQKAEQLAKRQGQIAEEFEKLGKKPANPQDLQETKRRSQQLLEELKQLPADEAQLEKQQAQQALAKAQETPNPAAHQQARQELRELAERLQKDQAKKPPTPEKKNGDRSPAELPNREDAGAARELAKEQRQLQKQLADVRDEMVGEKRPTSPRGNPLGEIAKTQEEIAKEAAKLAEQTSKGQGPRSDAGKQAEQAAAASKQATERLQNGDSSGGSQAGRGSATSLEQLAQSSKDGETSRRAKELATRQQELNQKLDALGGKGATEKVQQQARQKELEGEAKELTEKLGRLMEQVKPDSKARGAGNEAKEKLEAAQREMRKGAEMSRKNQPDVASESQAKAAEDLDRAARQAREAGQELGGKGDPGKEQLGQSLKDARDNMEEARRQLNRGNRPGARDAMKKAEESLSGAGKQLDPDGEPKNGADGQPGSPSPGGGEPGGNRGELRGAPDLKQFGPEAAKYEGKSWGELPGELRTKILQDLKARYGEDYAKNIKLYFEALAERK